MSINSEILRLETAKADIKEAIEAKGVAVDSAATLDAYAEYVDEISGGGTLQEKSIAVIANGTQTVLPDSGYDGFSKVVVNAAITGDSSALDFSIIGYDSGYSAQINAEFNADIAYSKSLKDKFNPSSVFSRFRNETDLIYAPMVELSGRTDLSIFFQGCSSLKYVPQLNTSNATTMLQMFDGCKNLTIIPLLDTSKVTNMMYMFNGCSKLTSIPLLDTSNVTNMNNMFQNCVSLTTIPQLNTSNVTGMTEMFSGCSGLTSIPLLDTSNVTNMQSMLSGCSGLTSIPQFDTSNVTNMQQMFSGCSGLTSIPLLDCSKVTNFAYLLGRYTAKLPNLTDLGGFTNLKMAWNDQYGLARCDNLTVQSLNNVIAGLYDFTGHSETPTSAQGKLKLGATNFNKLTAAEIAVGTAKGWTITA